MKKLEDDSISKPKQYDHEERRVVQTGTITVLSKLTIKQNFNKKCDTTIKKSKQWHAQKIDSKHNPNLNTYTQTLRKISNIVLVHKEKSIDKNDMNQAMLKNFLWVF